MAADKHSLLSPSSSHRWLACPGSVAANAKKTDTPSNFAKHGTVAHALLETCLRLDAEPADYLDTVILDDHVPVDDGMVDGVGHAIDYVRSYIANNPNTKVLIEAPVSYGASLGIGDSLGFGTGDIILDNYPVEAVAIDYKHGIGIVVEVKDNSQLLLYLLGLRQRRGKKYQRYRKVVIQPRAPRRRPVQEATVTDAQLMAWVNTKAKPAVRIALRNGQPNADAPRSAGNHCKYCTADGNCQAQYEFVMKAAQKEFKR